MNITDHLVYIKVTIETDQWFAGALRRECSDPWYRKRGGCHMDQQNLYKTMGRVRIDQMDAVGQKN